MITNFYTLPEIMFVGGETQELVFRLYTPRHYPYDMEVQPRVANFAILHYVNRDYETPILEVSSDGYSPQIEIQVGEEGVLNQVFVTLKPTDTLLLSGKYIYQLTLKDSSGEYVDIPNQGILYVIRNINPTFVTN